MTNSGIAAPAPVAGGPAVASPELDRTLVRGIAWTGGVKWACQAVTWISTLTVARILTPEDYGLVGMATVFLGLVNLVSEFGIGAAIVSLRTLTPEHTRQLNGFAVLFGLASALVTCAAAVPLSRFFHAPQLVLVVLAMSSTFVISSFRTVPSALLQKDLRFRSLALLEAVQSILLSLATMAFAFLGFGYWTLVISAILSSFTSAVLVVSRYPHPFAFPRLGAIREAMRFSSHIVVGRLSWYVYSNADFFTIGRVLGKGALGVYGIAWTLANVPIEKVTTLILRVTPALFAAVQDDLAQVRRYLLTVTEGLALFTFPATVGLALVAEDFVGVVLGERWAGAAGPLQLLALYASFRSITPLLPQILNICGHSRLGMWNSVAAAVALPIAFLFGTRWGAMGVAAAWIVVHPLVVLPLFWKVFRLVDLAPSRYLRALVPALTSTAIMAVAVLGARLALPAAAPPAAGLLVEIGVGGAAYVGGLWTLHRDRVEALRALLRSARG